MKAFFQLILLLLCPLVIIMGHSLMPTELGNDDYRLEKAHFPLLDSLALSLRNASTGIIDTIIQESPLSEAPDSVRIEAADILAQTSSLSEESHALHVSPSDSTKFNILFFGDSMLEGLARRMCDYTMENGYELTSVIWYSSSTQLWAQTDTLQYFLRQINPDYVVICLGSNELFVRDLERRASYIDVLVRKLSGRPFVWISPPNWKEDSGINQLIIDCIGYGRYFDSRTLDLERASDNIHPTIPAAACWMDTVARWMSSPAAAFPLQMSPPAEVRPRKFRQYLLKPVN